MKQPDTAPRRRLVLVQLNEVGFDLANHYAGHLKLDTFAKLRAGHCISTSSEQRYELLEPWIQWPSVYTGLSAPDHGITRLGQTLGHPAPQIFEELEDAGFQVGCISPMNAENRLRHPAYFVPDPWTATPSDTSWWSRSLSQAVGQVVNDNARSRVTARSVLHVGLGVLRFARLRHIDLYVRLALTCRGAPWRKALFLDVLLHDLHWHLFRTRKVDFSTVFLNAGAHIQHHYLFNARGGTEDGLRNPDSYVNPKADPVAEMLQVYDRLLADYLRLPDAGVIIATGLSQQRYDRFKHYWRLRDHAGFLAALGIVGGQVKPRMARDFLIEFDTSEQTLRAAEQLAAAQVEGKNAGEKLFGVIDNRGTSLFVTLTFPHDVGPAHFVRTATGTVPLAPAVALVAIKNGMHCPEGSAYFSPAVAPLAPSEGAHVKSLHQTILAFFGRTPRMSSASSTPRTSDLASV